MKFDLRALEVVLTSS